MELNFCINCQWQYNNNCEAISLAERHMSRSAGLVKEPAHYLYSSPGDYEGKKGLIEIDLYTNCQWQQNNNCEAISLAERHVSRSAGLVKEAAHYLYSSAGDYEGKKGLIEIDLYTNCQWQYNNNCEAISLAERHMSRSAGLVKEPAHYLYSSPGDYEGKKGLIEIDLYINCQWQYNNNCEAISLAERHVSRSAGLVKEPAHYLYSSPGDYEGKRGLIEIDLYTNCQWQYNNNCEAISLAERHVSRSAGLVKEPAHYLYSSPGDYEGKKGLIEIDLYTNCQWQQNNNCEAISLAERQLYP